MKIISRITFYLAVLTLFIYLIDGIYHNIKEYNSKMKEFVGDTVVIYKDTSVIVDYSVWRNNFKLSDGTEVPVKFLLNNIKSK